MLGMTGRHLLGMTDRLSARMMFKNHLLPCRAVDMGVDLRSGNIRMPEHFLNRKKIRAVRNQVRRKRVPQFVRRKLLSDSGLKRIFLQIFPKSLPRHATPTPCHEKRRDLRLRIS